MKLRRAAIYIAIAAALALILVMVMRMAPSASVDTPKVVLPTAPLPTESVRPETSPGGEKTIDVTPETVQTAIATLTRSDSYSRTVRVETFWPGGSSVTETSVWVRQTSARLLISGGKNEKNVLIRGDELWIWYSDSADIYHGPASGAAADEYQMLLTYEGILDLPVSAITAAGYTEYAGEKCIYAEFVSGELDYTYSCWVSIGTGLLMGAYVCDADGTLIYSMTSGQPDISTPDESIFTLPGEDGSAGVTAETSLP
jgi:hypothetical protein